MKSYFKALISAFALAEIANALEHPSLTAAHDYQEKWTEVEKKNSAF